MWKYRKTILLVFCLTLAVGFFVSARGLFAQESSLESEKRQLEEQIEELNKKINEYQNALGEKHGEVVSLQQQIATINSRIGKLNAEIKRTEGEIHITRINISETEGSIYEAEVRIVGRQEEMAELLRTLHMMGNETLLERLLKYETISEAVAVEHQLQTLYENLSGVVRETARLRGELEGDKVVLEENEESLEEKNRELSVRKSAEASEKANRDAILSATKQEEAKYQALLSQAEAERAAYMQRILALEQETRQSGNFLSYFKAGSLPPPGTKIFVWPIDGATVTQGWGYTAFSRRGAYGGQGHNGVDMTGGIGSPIKSIAEGKVVARGASSCTNYVNRACNGYWGNWVAIEHPGGLVSLYAHMSSPSHRSVGTAVKAGDVIGYEGATGNVTGSHLHLTVYTEFFTFTDPATGAVRFSYNFGKTINPLSYL
jgi:murein DD-endopeptidase MepM/ murein hydrolase activator NlpD